MLWGSPGYHGHDERDTADEADFDIKTVRFDTMMTSVEKVKPLAKMDNNII